MSTREQTINRFEAERAATWAVVESATEEELLYTPAGRWSCKDIIGHLAIWEGEFERTLHQVARGQTGSIYTIADVDEYNAQQAAQRVGLSLHEQIEELRQVRRSLLITLQYLPAEVFENQRIQRSLHAMPAHDADHIPSLRERLALARSQQRQAAVHRLEYGRQQLLSTLELLPVEALDERTPGKWSIKETLLYLASRDELFASAVQAVAAGVSVPAAALLEGAYLDLYGEEQVANHAHAPAFRALHHFGEMRGRFVGTLLTISDAAYADPRVQEWMQARREHDEQHLAGIVKLARRFFTRHDTSTGRPEA